MNISKNTPKPPLHNLNIPIVNSGLKNTFNQVQNRENRLQSNSFKKISIIFVICLVGICLIVVVLIALVFKNKTLNEPIELKMTLDQIS